MSMFNNYQNIPVEYVPNNIKPPDYYHPAVKFPLEEYDIRGNLIGFSWKYLDTIVLEFTTTGNVLYDDGIAEDADLYLENKKFSIKVYNFRYEEMFEDVVEASNYLKYYIPTKLKEMLIPGTYSMSVTLIDEENDVVQTLLDSNILKIFIK